MKIIGSDYYTACSYAFAHDDTYTLHLNDYFMSEYSGYRAYTEYLKSFERYTVQQDIELDQYGAFLPLFVVVGYKLYRGLFVYETEMFETKIVSMWSVDEFNDYLVKNPKAQKQLKDKYGPQVDGKLYENNIRKNWFGVEIVPEEQTEWMRMTETPILIGVGASHDDLVDWYYNSSALKDVGFSRVMDSWTIYQEIDMWINSEIVAKEPEMVQLSDESVRDKHGFGIMSFKKEAHQSKPRGKK